MADAMPDGAFKLCIGPRPRAGLFVRRDIRAYESLGREDPVVKLSLESLTHTFSSRQRQAARMGIILFAMAHEAMRCSLHQVTPALQVFWRRLSSKLFCHFPGVVRARFVENDYNLQNNGKHKERNGHANAQP